MAEAGGLPKRKIDAEDGADALHKRRRISGSNFHEDRLQAVSSLSLKKSMISPRIIKLKKHGRRKSRIRPRIKKLMK
ncbi:hypothetical protein AMTR_s00005p00264680 [Amborella trichopoda]|uniref:Uncharacterized protein n=1 Tax=Amborella trichopoda TaxID=13333 RepID=W1PG52_AMBTC|nr:hypothetical protein AMTR_s00005p00264680 [Amborella trichopoda]